MKKKSTKEKRKKRKQAAEAQPKQEAQPQQIAQPLQEAQPQPEAQARENIRRRVRLHEVDLKNDIRYRGPLSYLGFQILGWMAIVASAAVLLINTGGKLDPSVTESYGQISLVLSYVSTLSLPCLLIANFAPNTPGPPGPPRPQRAKTYP